VRARTPIRSDARRRWALLGILALGLVVIFAQTLVSSAEAKKKHKKSASVFRAQVSPNAAIPDGVSTQPPPPTPVISTINVGKKFKGKVVDDVNVTGIQTTGNNNTSASDLGFRISAPNGRGVLIIDGGLAGASIGPLTLDDDTAQSICFSTNPCFRAPQTLDPPYAGTANDLFFGSGGTGPLSAFDGLPMKGTWTLMVWDFNNNSRTSVLNSWGLQITAARPVK
jgi:hypothetical protein